jgi:hypothetical protein
VQVADHLSQVELTRKMIVDEVVDLLCRISVGIRPASQRQPWLPLTNFPPQLRGMLDAAPPSDRFVAAKNHEAGEPVLSSLLGVGETEIERMLARQKRHHLIAR